jgi:hypothetical protein
MPAGTPTILTEFSLFFLSPYKKIKDRILDQATTTSFHILCNSLFTTIQHHTLVGASHMSDNRLMSVAMQRLVDSISIVTNNALLCNNTVTLYLRGFQLVGPYATVRCYATDGATVK